MQTRDRLVFAKRGIASEPGYQACGPPSLSQVELEIGAAVLVWAVASPEPAGHDNGAPLREGSSVLDFLGSTKMATGKVKWFNKCKGFGAITPDAGGDDLFAHFSEIQSNGLKRLAEGQKVTHDEKMGPKGKQASNLKPA